MKKRILLTLLSFSIFLNLYCGETPTQQDKEKDFVASWVLGGLDTYRKTASTVTASSSSSSSACSDPAPKFSSVTAVSSSCNSCHGSAGGVDMTSYSSVSAKVTAKSPASSALYTSVTTGTMASKSNSTINTAIYCWILGGANP